MTGASGATPLIAIDAVVLDTETTGLDPATARIVEIAALRLDGGRIAGAPVSRLVNPGIPVPESARAIHGIGDAALAGAAPFAAVWAEFAPLLADRVTIGHAIGFDLAVLARECARAGAPWLPPPTLDTRLLAEIVEPRLAGYALENLAAWLEIAVTDRHSAAGDAATTARIYLALLPRLRDRGIRTLAEAQQNCRALSASLERRHRAGWSEGGTASREQALDRIDTYPYRHRVCEVMSPSPRFVAASTLLRAALAQMVAERISSVFVRGTEGDAAAMPASAAGIVTERDVLRALATHGDAALGMPVGRFASRPLATVPAEAFIYRAIGRMDRLGTRHLGVVDQGGNIVGALSARDLLRLRARDAVALGDAIDQARDTAGLAAAWARLPVVARALLGEQVGARQIAAVISRELCALTRQASVIAEARMREAGHGGPPCPFALAVLGSAARGESLLAMDQDNALVFAEGAPEGPADRWFAAFGTHVADILHEAGVPYCPGGIMAKNPQWRGSIATWRDRAAGWLRRTAPRDLLAVDIFFDMLPVHGDGALAENVRRDAMDLAAGQAAFAKLLAEAAGRVEPGLGLFGRFRTLNGRIDLKKAGLFGIVTTARVLAIRHRIDARETPARLAAIAGLGLGAAEDLDALTTAQQTFLDLILDQQVADSGEGIRPGNAVAVRRLDTADRERLKQAFAAVANLEEVTRDLLFKD